MSWAGFIEEYAKAEEKYGDTSDFLIHFRITSKGSTTLDNCHPFKVNDDMAIIHNGTITSVYITPNDTRSDTRVFAEEYLRELPEGWHHNGVINVLIEEFIGYSKVILLHRTDGVQIFNEEKGIWHEGCWFSNASYEPSKTRWYSTFKKGAPDSYEDWQYSECDHCNSRELWENLETYRPVGATRNQYLCPDCFALAMINFGEGDDTKLKGALTVIDKNLPIVIKPEDVDKLIVELNEDDYVTLHNCDYCCDSFESADSIVCIYVEERAEYMYLCEECLDLFMLSGCTVYAVDADGVIGEEIQKCA